MVTNGRIDIIFPYYHYLPKCTFLKTEILSCFFLHHFEIPSIIQATIRYLSIQAICHNKFDT